MQGLEALLVHLRDRLAVDRPGGEISPILHCVRDFAAWQGHLLARVPPSAVEIAGYLKDRRRVLGGRYAYANLANLQLAAPIIWSVETAAVIGMVLRQERTVPKAPATTGDERARAAIARLLTEVQGGLLARLPGASVPKRQVWSTSHTASVAHALARWLRWCDAFGYDAVPSGVRLNAYVEDVLQDGVSVRSAADYIGRIHSGHLAAVDPRFRSLGVEHVIAQTNARARKTGHPTKTGDQLVGASTIYDLGLDIIASARSQGPRGLHVARDFRNGLLLAIAAALPQRARALSHLSAGTTLTLLEAPLIHVALPGRVLKLREYLKGASGYEHVFGNPELWSALDDYLRNYRILFDDGAAIFPSILDIGAAISSAQLGRLAGDLTKKHLKVRVSIHRIRDTVATEAAEQMTSGGYLAPALLGHKDAATTMDSYVHAEGFRAAVDYGAFLDRRRSVRATLRLKKR